MKQCLEHKLRCHIFKNNLLNILDTISLIDVYENLIHAAIQ